jgi:hypothetical protein
MGNRQNLNPTREEKINRKILYIKIKQQELLVILTHFKIKPCQSGRDEPLLQSATEID